MTTALQAAPDAEAQVAMIIDDHPLFCDALSIVLKMVAGIRRVTTADRLRNARILSPICNGKPDKQFACDLSIAETTVKAHVTAIMRKPGVQSRTQALLIAQQAKYAT